MAWLTRIALLSIVNVLMYVLAEEELYSDEFDNLDVQKLIDNADLRKQYLDCFFETGPCTTPQMKFFTGIFSEAFQTNCKKCTKKQKEIFAIGEEWMQKNEPETWERVLKKISENMKKKAAGEELYTDEYDNLDVHAALDNPAVRESYYECYMEIAPCETPRQTALTKMFSEALQTKCRKCTEKQKKMFAVVEEWYKKNNPLRWQLLFVKSIQDMKKRTVQ